MFFIDEININNETISALQDQTIQNIDIYPNPSTAGVNIDVQGTDVSNFQIEIGNLTGHYLYKISPESISGDKIRFVINKDNQLLPGIYFVKIKKEGFTDIVRKIVVTE